MALTLPVEEMSRLQVFFKLSFPDGKLTFEMASSSTSQSTNPSPVPSGLKLHFQGGHDKTGLCLKVWASDLWEGSGSASESTTNTNGPSGMSMPPTLPSTSSTSPGMGTDITPMQPNGAGHYSPTAPFGGAAAPLKGQVPRHDAHAYTQSYPDVAAELFQWPTMGTEPHIADDFEYQLDEFALNNMKWLGYDQNTMDVTEASISPEIAHMHGGDQRALQHTEPKPNAEPMSNMLSSSNEFIPVFQHASISSPSTITSSSTVTSYTSNTLNSTGPKSLSGSDDTHSTLSRSEVQSIMTDTPATPSTRHSTPEIDSSRPYRCLAPDCDRWFKRDYTRKVHMLTHRRTKERKPFGCSVADCPERFSRKHDRLRHEVGRHGLGSEWRCAPCNRFFSSKATLERHILDKHGETALTSHPSQ